MSELRKTVLHGRPAALGAERVEVAGWEMPIQYPTGIVTEHLKPRCAGPPIFVPFAWRAKLFIQRHLW